MDADSPIADRRLQILGELAELGLSIARELHEAVRSAEDAGEKARLAEAFHRVGRSVRQSLALHARLERDGQRQVREDTAEVVRLDAVRVARRKAQVKGAVERLVWTEHERLETEPDQLIEWMDLILDAEAETEDFLARDPDVQIRRLCHALGLLESDPPADVAVRPSG